MKIGNKLRTLRLRMGFTQEELGERTDLTKGYISQLERDQSSPSMDTLFSILEVLGSSPKDFFSDDALEEKVVYTKEDYASYENTESKFHVTWLVTETNDKEMEPILLTLEKNGQYKKFEPSHAEVFIHVVEGCLQITLGTQNHILHDGESAYFKAKQAHQLKNKGDGQMTCYVVATQSYF